MLTVAKLVEQFLEAAEILDGVSFAVLVLLLTRKALEKVTMMLAAWWTMEMGTESLSCSLSPTSPGETCPYWLGSLQWVPCCMSLKICTQIF